MSRKYRVLVNGNEFEVEVGPSDGSSRVRAERSSDSSSGGSSAPPSGPAPGIAAPSETAITAMIPGRVISVEVQEGDVVTAGQPVVILESMKMEQTIASHRDGRIKRVCVEPGQAVAHGETLVEFE